MTQYECPAYIHAQPQQTNTLALVGFICALIGLFSGGIVAPVGLVLSLIALGRQPRGLAVAGVVISAFSLCGWGLLWLFMAGAILAAIGIVVGAAAFMSLSDPVRTEVTVEMAVIAAAIESHRDRNGFLPASFSELGLDEPALTDPWGNRYEYHFEDSGKTSYELVSLGEDGRAGTGDDIALSKLPELWQTAARKQFKGFKRNRRVTIESEGRILEIRSDDADGVVRIDTGDRIIEISDDDQGARVTSTPK